MSYDSSRQFDLSKPGDTLSHVVTIALQGQDRIPVSIGRSYTAEQRKQKEAKLLQRQRMREAIAVAKRNIVHHVASFQVGVTLDSLVEQAKPVANPKPYGHFVEGDYCVYAQIYHQDGKPGKTITPSFRDKEGILIPMRDLIGIYDRLRIRHVQGDKEYKFKLNGDNSVRASLSRLPKPSKEPEIGSPVYSYTVGFIFGRQPTV